MVYPPELKACQRATSSIPNGYASATGYAGSLVE